MSQLKSYLIYSLLDTAITYPERSLKREKQKASKKTYKCHLAFSDGFMMAFNEYGLTIGYQTYIPNYTMFPAFPFYEDMHYAVLKGKDYTVKERNLLIEKSRPLSSLPGEDTRDCIKQVMGQEVPGLSTLKKMTHSSYLAYLLDIPDYPLWDSDRLYEELGEWGIPGTATTFEYLPLSGP